ncbi:aminopeptidase [Myxococcota bacterium]
MRLSLVILTTWCCCLPACSTLGYLAQATYGHLDLLSRAQPIEWVLHENAPPKLTRLLLLVPSIRAFGNRHGLTISENYQTYAELDREAAVWVVTACAPLSFEPKIWEFPIVGSFPYLGWFDKREALHFADGLAREGWDVHVRGASAYSTLGWFRDPILSTMLTRGASVTGDFVNTILHESVHATVYVDGQGYFNESIALFVADRMTPQYLRETHGAGSPELGAYVAEETRRQGDEQLMLGAYAQLDTVYASDRDNLAKLARKYAILEKLEIDLELDDDKNINNATLEGFRVYRVGQETLADLLQHCGHDWGRFLDAVSSVSPEDFSTEQQEDLEPVLSPLLARTCD